MSSPRAKGLKQWFPNIFARGPRLSSKNNHRLSHPCSRKHRLSGWYVSKIIYLYLRTDFR